MSINIYQKLVKNESIQLTCWYKLKKNCTQETFNTFEHCWIYWFKLKKKTRKFKSNFKYSRHSNIFKKWTYSNYLKKKLILIHLEFVFKFKFEIWISKKATNFLKFRYVLIFITKLILKYCQFKYKK